MPLHTDIPASWLRPPEQFVKDGKNVFIHFQRTGRIPDDRLTDDELTPYLFVDDKLASIGWTALGGPKSFGQSNSNDLAASLALINLGNSLMTGNQGTTSSSYGTSSATDLTGETVLVLSNFTTIKEETIIQLLFQVLLCLDQLKNFASLMSLREKFLNFL